jgi:hypothetical protein
MTVQNWQNIDVAQPGVDDVLTLADATGTAGAIRFYRVLVNP